jgi:hypothetical protein
VDIEHQDKTAILTYLLEVRSGRGQDGITIVHQDTFIDLGELPLEPTLDDIRTVVGEQLLAEMAKAEERYTAVLAWLMKLFLDLASEYDQADPDADIAGFIRRQMPGPQLKAV